MKSLSCVKGMPMDRPLTAAQLADLDALAKLPDDGIATVEMPEQTDWSGARRGMFFRTIKIKMAHHAKQ
jgi:hypothetical protein